MKILLLGYSVRGLAELAAHSSCPSQLLALDNFADLDLGRWARVINRQPDLGKTAFDAVAYVSGLESCPELLEELAQDKIVLGNSPQTLRQLQDTKKMIKLLEDNQIYFPQVLYPGQIIPHRGKWLLKEQARSGGVGVSWAKAGLKVPEGFIGQQFLSGRPASVSFVAGGQNFILLGLNEQLCGVKELDDKNFLYRGNLFPLELPAYRSEVILQVRKMVAVVTKAYRLKGLNGLDFLFLSDGKIAFLELNPRYCASMELYWHGLGIDLFKLHLESCLGKLALDDFPLAFPTDKYWGKAIVYAPESVKTGDTSFWFDLGIRDIPQPGQRIGKGEPVCTVFSSGSSRSTCLRELKRKQEYVLGLLDPFGAKPVVRSYDYDN